MCCLDTGNAFRRGVADNEISATVDDRDTVTRILQEELQHMRLVLAGRELARSMTVRSRGWRNTHPALTIPSIVCELEFRLRAKFDTGDL